MKRNRGRKVGQGRINKSGNKRGYGRGSGRKSGKGHGNKLTYKTGTIGELHNRSMPYMPPIAKEALVQPNTDVNRREELIMTEKQMHITDSQELAEDTRTSETGKEGKSLHLVAVVDAESCTECGACEEVCPEEAISMNDTAIVDQTLCTGCGQCVEECPTEAISLHEI